MNISKWIQQNLNGIIIGILVSIILFPSINTLIKILIGGFIGGYIYSLMSSKGQGKNYGAWWAIFAGPIGWITAAGIGLLTVVLGMFKKQPPTLSEQLAEIPMWAWFVAGFLLLLMIKTLKKKPRTIIIQEQR